MPGSRPRLRRGRVVVTHRSRSIVSHEAAEEIFSRTATRYGEDIEAQRGLWLIGTPSEVVAQLRPYADIGISHCIMHFDDPFDEKTLRFLREEVVPAFR